MELDTRATEAMEATSTERPDPFFGRKLEITGSYVRVAYTDIKFKDYRYRFVAKISEPYRKGAKTLAEVYTGFYTLPQLRSGIHLQGKSYLEWVCRRAMLCEKFRLSPFCVDKIGEGLYVLRQIE